MPNGIWHSGGGVLLHTKASLCHDPSIDNPPPCALGCVWGFCSPLPPSCVVWAAAVVIGRLTPGTLLSVLGTGGSVLYQNLPTVPFR